MTALFGRHRIRATFYHLVAIVFLISTVLCAVGWIGDKASYVITAILFVVDYLAEMYDPHPDNPGPWFQAHFHRAIDDVKEDVCEFTRLVRSLSKCRLGED